MGAISDFIRHHYRHFNGAALVDAADAYVRHLDGGGQMLVTLAGAMSTAELGLSLAEMIRRNKVHAICCTGANLEEDVFNLVAHSHYERVPHYRDLTPADEQALFDRHLNRVTDTCIPEEEAMRRIERIEVAVARGSLEVHAGCAVAARRGPGRDEKDDKDSKDGKDNKFLRFSPPLPVRAGGRGSGEGAGG